MSVWLITWVGHGAEAAIDSCGDGRGDDGDDCFVAIDDGDDDDPGDDNDEDDGDEYNSDFPSD